MSRRKMSDELELLFVRWEVDELLVVVLGDDARKGSLRWRE
jgi:hypothetical protein